MALTRSILAYFRAHHILLGSGAAGECVALSRLGSLDVAIMMVLSPPALTALEEKELRRVRVALLKAPAACFSSDDHLGDGMAHRAQVGERLRAAQMQALVGVGVWVTR